MGDESFLGAASSGRLGNCSFLGGIYFEASVKIRGFGLAERKS